MPGGRLSQQERQQIAAGLAGGLAYAEIARRLQRPTSTVTREVLRNGGPAAYRAETAHRATERRASRRREPAPQGAVPAQGRGPGRGPDHAGGAVRAYEEAFAALLMQQGLPRMAARVLTCLYTADEGGLTAAQLVRRLQVSAASVSKAVAFLEGQGLVRRERAEGRRERYSADDDVWYQSTLAAARSSLQLAETARQGVHILGPGSPAAVRLENIARFVDFIGESIQRAAEQAKDVLRTSPRGAGEATPGPSPQGPRRRG
ncbi:GbsR/MarR family transcriptional regulator [Streptomyces indicus]|uniref:MarR family protein n=1 Tax=Streptomyces indicus TaxID=417292 RepID=A0A1G9B441_9ACTN|nr:MarR family transcriptional regulator [Streptomyces indicus]SDK33864.1 MarR family protein [Streptomyces indicus]